MIKTTDSEALPDPSLDAEKRGDGEDDDVSREMLNSVPAVIFRCALDDGRLLSLNAAWLRLLGYEPELCLDQPLTSFVVASQQDLVRQALDRLRAGAVDPESVDELRFFHAGGEEITTELKMTSRPGSAEAIGVIHDLTARQQAHLLQRVEDEKAQQAERLESLGQLAGGIAHDFNNLLMGVLGNADLALAKLSPFSPGCEHIRGIVTHARRAADLCRQMLAYSGKGKFTIKAVELTTLIDEMKHLIASSLPEGITVEYDLAIGLPSIEADPPQIQQMITHLVQNASEAIGEGGGTITITSGSQHCEHEDLRHTLPGDDLPEGNYTYLEISDTGCGLDEESRARIFEPFFSTKKMAGRGLGLAAVLGIVRGHNGTIQVDSEPGRGTSIRVLFPSSEQPAAEAPQVSFQEEADRSAGTILVVDDEEIVRSVARGMLELLGYHVLTAGDGYEAIKIFRERGNEIVLVVLDLAMPHLSGEETFEGLRAIQPDARVVLSSGYDEQEATLHFAGKGLAGFIQKPYEVASFSRVIHDALEGTGII